MNGARRPGRGDARALAAAALVASPVAIGILYAAAASIGLVGAGASGAGVDRLLRVLEDRVTWSGLGFTLRVAAMSTVLATAGAVTVAIIFRRHVPLDRAARALAALPLTVPHLVAGMLGVWVLGQSGLLARLAVGAGVIDGPAQMPALIYDEPGVGLVLAMAWKEMAFLSVVATALLATQAEVVEEASRTLGAGPWDTFRRVTWPLLWRGLLPAVTAVFVFVAGSYEAAALLAPSDPAALPVLVLERAADPDLARRGDAYVVSLLLLAIGVLAVFVHEWTRARWEPGGR